MLSLAVFCGEVDAGEIASHTKGILRGLPLGIPAGTRNMEHHRVLDDLLERQCTMVGWPNRRHASDLRCLEVRLTRRAALARGAACQHLRAVERW